MDGSDEESSLCSRWECKFDEISCGDNGPCLPAILKCDGVQHCANAADESNCAETCSDDQFHCTWQHKCIPEAWQCDGKADCAGGEDEHLCDCEPNEFKCNTGRCVTADSVCDGEPQCPDLSDEWNCLNLTKTSTNDGHVNVLKIRRTMDEFDVVCADDWNEQLSDIVCSKLGYAKALKWMSHAWTSTNETIIKIRGDFEQNQLITSNETETCESGSVVSIECEPFRKYFFLVFLLFDE